MLVRLAQKLLVAERKVLRKILGPVKTDDYSYGWRIRKNVEIDCGQYLNIIDETEAHRFQDMNTITAARWRENAGLPGVYIFLPLPPICPLSLLCDLQS